MVRVHKASLAVAIVSALVQVIDTQQNITPSTCANPGGFTACFQQARNTFLVCSASAGSDLDEQAVCSCDLDLAEIGCAVESCWNVVYGCEYQSLALFWDAGCFGTLGDIPFFPAPENASGGCSCNLGQILGNFTNVYKYYNSCVSAGRDLYACGCCQQGGELTSIYSICPDDDLSALGLSVVEKLLSTADSDPSFCATYFNQYDCVSDLGYPPIGTLSYLRALPSSTGTLNPSTTAGSITTPLCGSTCVLTVGKTPTTITPMKEMTASTSGAAGSSSTTATTTGVAGHLPNRWAPQQRLRPEQGLRAGLMAPLVYICS